MYSQYKMLLNHKSQSEFQKFVKDAEINELSKMILEVLNTSEVLSMLDNILQGFSELNMHFDKRQKLVKTVFDAIRQAKVSNKHVDSIVNKIASHFSMFNKTYLANFVDYFIERIRYNDDNFMSWKDVLPVLLEKIEEEKSINYRGNDVSGQEYKIIIIRSICDIDWDIKIISSIAKLFVELITDIKDKAMCGMIMKALTSKLMTVDFNELPPLVHQMLKIGYDHNTILLYSTLSKYFAIKYAAIPKKTDAEDISDSITHKRDSYKELQEVESTVLYYIYQSVLDNTKGSLEYLKYLKSIVNLPEYILDTFVMSILLLISDLYEDQTLQILKLAFLRQIQDEEIGNNSAWLRQVSTNKPCVLEKMYEVIENSNKDRQLILKGMVDFAFILLSTERKGIAVNYLPWTYGGKILQKIARKRHDAAGTILEQLVDKIVRSGSNTIQYTDCLAQMCRRLTMTVLDHQTWIRILLDQLLVVPGNTSSHILKAILPLVRVSSSIRDNLIMILRKALYRKGTQTRQMAVLGFIQLLKNLKLSTLTTLSQSDSLSSSNVASSSSFFTQATLERPSHRSSSNPWHNTSLCREILAILSKCFTHEIEVRSHLYKELYYGILKNEELTEYVIEMLLEHFFKYYTKDEEILPPVCFEKCSIDQGIDIVQQEPLQDLIFTLQKIYIKVASKDSPKIDKLADVLESLSKRMIETDLEHMGIDEDYDILDNSPKANQKLLSIKLAISTYESLMAYKIGSWSLNSVDIGQVIIGLFKGYSRLVEYIKKISKAKKGRGKGKKDKDKDDNDSSIIKKPGRSINLKLLSTVMDFEVISKSVVLLYNQSNSWSTSDQSSGIRGRYEFHLYILQTCLQLLQNVKGLKDNEIKDCLELNKQHFILIGETLYKFIITDLKSVSSFHEEIATLGTECFNELSDILCSIYPSVLPAFLENVSGISSSENLSSQLQEMISLLKDIFIMCLNDGMSDNAETQKLPLNVIETISKFVNKLNFNEVKANKSLEWPNYIMENRDNVDVQIVLLILQLILFIEEQSIDYGETIQDICTELFLVLGRIDKLEVSVSRKYQIVNEQNVHPIFIALNKILSSKLQNVSWLLCRLNAEYIIINSFESNDESKQKEIKSREQALCRQFTFILGIFEILSSVKITPGQASEILFKNLQKVYNFASSLAKYFRKKSTTTNPAFQSVKFIPVIQGAGNALKEAITELILHVESSQNSGKSNDAFIQRNKILKEVMVIPGVVQAINMFDKEIALLSKKTGVDLMKYIKYDVIRDFRIQNSQLRENLEKMNVSLVITQTAPKNKKKNVTSEDSSNDNETEEALVKRKRTK